MEVVSIVLQVLLGLMFVMAGVTKIAGQKMHVDNFDHWRLPQWFRPITGAVELIGGAALIAGIWVDGLAGWAGIWLGFTMLVGILVHVRVKDSMKQTGGAIGLMVFSLVVVVLRYSELNQLFS
jgi:putative oxidoreductase